MSEYRAEWPLTLAEADAALRQAARDDLADMLEADGLVALGHVKFTVTATVTVQREQSAIGDLRPWESAEAARDELLGGPYALDELVYERFGTAA